MTSRERRHFPAPTSWPHAGNDSSCPSRRDQRTVRSLFRYNRLPIHLSQAYDLKSVQMRWSNSAAITSAPELGAGIKSP